MGKLIRNGIEYGGGNGTDIFEVTQAEYDALVLAGTLVHNALYVITDAPNLNETAKEISYEGSTATVWDKVEEIKTDLGTRLVGAWIADNSQGNATRLTNSITCTAGTYIITMTYPNIDTTQFVAGLFSEATGAIYDNGYTIGVGLSEHTIITAFSATTKVYMASAQGAWCTFTSKERGSLRAIKLSDRY